MNNIELFFTLSAEALHCTAILNSDDTKPDTFDTLDI
jgi:hypothetical protein